MLMVICCTCNAPQRANKSPTSRTGVSCKYHGCEIKVNLSEAMGTKSGVWDQKSSHYLEFGLTFHFVEDATLKQFGLKAFKTNSKSQLVL